MRYIRVVPGTTVYVSHSWLLFWIDSFILEYESTNCVADSVLVLILSRSNYLFSLTETECNSLARPTCLIIFPSEIRKTKQNKTKQGYSLDQAHVHTRDWIVLNISSHASSSLKASNRKHRLLPQFSRTMSSHFCIRLVFNVTMPGEMNVISSAMGLTVT